MKITQEEIVDRQTVLHIELEDADLAPYLDRGYRRVVQRIMIPGFRKGKAPRQIVERYLGREGLLNEVLDFMLPDVTSRAISAQSLDAAGLPKMELLDLNPVTVKAVVPLTPEIDLGNYREIRVPVEPVTITEEDVQMQLQGLRERMAAWEPVERPLQMGDMVTMEIKATVEGRTVLADDDALYLAERESEYPVPGFGEQIEGMEKGQTREFTLKVPEGFRQASLAGKDAHFTVTIKEIKGKKLPDLDDEFAKSVGDDYDSLAALREDVEKHLREEAERQKKDEYREAVMKALLERASIKLPPVIIEHELEHIEADQEDVLGKARISRDDYLRYLGKTQEQQKEEMRQEAIERITRTFLLSKVAEAEGITVSDQELEERFKEVMGDDEGPRRGRRRSNSRDLEEERRYYRRLLLVEKTLERLLAIARGEAPEPGPAAPAPEAPAPEKTEQERPQG